MSSARTHTHTHTGTIITMEATMEAPQAHVMESRDAADAATLMLLDMRYVFVDMFDMSWSQADPRRNADDDLGVAYCFCCQFSLVAWWCGFNRCAACRFRSEGKCSCLGRSRSTGIPDADQNRA